MLPDDDLLGELSCDLGFSELLDVHTIDSDDSPFDKLLDPVSSNDESSIFPDFVFTDSGLTSPPDSYEIKMEPYSPDSSNPYQNSSTSGVVSFPPSPSGSDSSASSTDYTTKQGVGAMEIGETIRLITPGTAYLSPPVSPPSMDLSNLTNIINLSGVQCFTIEHLEQPAQVPAPVASAVIQTQVSTVRPSPNFKESTKSKIAIPKISKSASTRPTPLVLTPQQLSQLAQSGMLKVASHAPKATVTSFTTATTTATTKSTSSTAPRLFAAAPPAPIVIKSEFAGSNLKPVMPYSVQSVKPHATEADLKNLRRQQRMIKNRESACLSRKKKKEYLTNLEDQLNLLSKENMQLKQENESLKARLREYESDKSTIWMDSFLTSSQARKGTALFALLFVVSLNLGALSSLNPNIGPLPDVASPSSQVNRQPRHVGRTLLWDQPFSTEDPSYSSPNLSTMCPLSVNQSESIRLDNQLRGWFTLDVASRNVTVHDEDRHLPARKNKKSKVMKVGENSNTALGHYSKPAVHSLTGSIYNMLITDRAAKFGNSKYGFSKRTPDGQLTVYEEASAPRFSFESFFEAIHRREDTFYVVSFSGDHLLLPATSRNQSVRPRMSLILPSVTLPVNESMQALPNHVIMMQIDCEVINTGLVHIHEDAIPLHLKMRSSPEASAFTASEASSNSSLQRNESQKPAERFGDFDNNISVASASVSSASTLNLLEVDDVREVERAVRLPHSNDDIEMAHPKLTSKIENQAYRSLGSLKGLNFLPGRNRRIRG